MRLKKCKIRGQRGRGLGHVPTVQFWDPLYIPGKTKDINLKFGVQIDYDEYYSKYENIGD